MFQEVKRNSSKLEKNKRYLNISDNELLIVQTGKLSFDKRPDLTIRASKTNLKKLKEIYFLLEHILIQKKMN